MRKIIIAALVICSTAAHSQEVELRTWKGTKIRVDTVAQVLQLLEPLYSPSPGRRDSLIIGIDWGVIKHYMDSVVSTFKVTKGAIDTGVIHYFVDLALNRSGAPRFQRIEAVTGQKVFSFILPNTYIVVMQGKILSQNIDYLHDGFGNFTIKKARKNYVVRLISLE